MEKRAHPRVQLAYPVTVVTDEGRFQAVTLNVSTQGVAVLSNSRIGLGPCEIELEDQSIPGKILYEHAEGKGSIDPNQEFFHYGIHLDEFMSEKFIQLLTENSG